MTSPPRPPSPPSGPPIGANFSRRNEVAPDPPVPALTLTMTRSMNTSALGSTLPFGWGSCGFSKLGSIEAPRAGSTDEVDQDAWDKWDDRIGLPFDPIAIAPRADEKGGAVPLFSNGHATMRSLATRAHPTDPTHPRHPNTLRLWGRPRPRGADG